jgi:hypothetical protein
MRVLAFSLSRFPDPDVSKAGALSAKPVPRQLHISSKRRHRLSDAGRRKMDRCVAVERTVFFRCKNSGGHDVANLGQPKACGAAASPIFPYFIRLWCGWSGGNRRTQSLSFNCTSRASRPIKGGFGAFRASRVRVICDTTSQLCFAVIKRVLSLIFCADLLRTIRKF